MAATKHNPWRGWWAGPALVALAIAALVVSATPAEAASPFRGNASWVWYVSDSGGSGAAIGSPG